MSKTISMPLEEYEKELSTLKNGLEIRSYQKGVLETIRMIRERVLVGNRNAAFVDPELEKTMSTLLADLEKDRIYKGITHG